MGTTASPLAFAGLLLLQVQLTVFVVAVPFFIVSKVRHRWPRLLLLGYLAVAIVLYGLVTNAVSQNEAWQIHLTVLSFVLIVSTLQFLRHLRGEALWRLVGSNGLIVSGIIALSWAHMISGPSYLGGEQRIHCKTSRKGAFVVLSEGCIPDPSKTSHYLGGHLISVGQAEVSRYTGLGVALATFIALSFFWMPLPELRHKLGSTRYKLSR